MLAHRTAPSLAHPVMPAWRASSDVVALALVLALCVALRAYHLASASLWADEVFSRYYADLFGLRFLLTDGLRAEPNPPTYPLLLQAWMGVFGDGAAALRSLSVLACTLGVPVVYALGRELIGRREALLGALLFALCPIGLYFAQEARVYAMLLPASGLVLWAAAVFLRNHRSTGAILGYVFGGALCLYLHATAVLLIVACGGCVGAALLALGRGARPALARWVALNAAVFALGLPYLVNLGTASRSGSLDWMQPLHPHDVAMSVAAVVDGMVMPYPWPAIPLAGAALAALAASLIARPPSMRALIVLVAVPCAFVAMVVLISLARPILLPRVLCWTIVPLCAVIGGQLLGAGRMRFAVLGTVAAAFGIGLALQVASADSNKDPWRDALRAVAPQLRQADLVVLSPHNNAMLARYYVPGVKGLRSWDAGFPPSIESMAADRMGISHITRPQILQAIAAKQTVWVLADGVDLEFLDRLREAVPATTAQSWQCGKTTCIGVASWSAASGPRHG